MSEIRKENKEVLIDKFGSISNASEKLQISSSYIYNFLNGKDNVPKHIVEKLKATCGDNVKEENVNKQELEVKSEKNRNEGDRYSKYDLKIDYVVTPYGNSQVNWNLNSIIVKIKTQTTEAEFNEWSNGRPIMMVAIDTNTKGGELIPVRMSISDGYVCVMAYNPGNNVFIRQNDTVATMILL